MQYGSNYKNAKESKINTTELFNIKDENTDTQTRENLTKGVKL
ncbi:hypothetical protein [Clostridium scatologenes]|uniref:Uncharacterized protein n=1 Tax=Clostridium scatologenes TaxID=1548 RepID=A0A0E3JX91_CLOSL|nr:hypothetical protein [Clostridium scatologenes]AKA67905.1 hypothetical protein CSCA_0780 [Clostridium scatologenes]